MDIIYYGNDPWKDNPSFRKQIFAEYLSKRGHRILYIQRDPKRKFGNRIVNFFTNRSLIRKSDNFYLYYRPENFRGHTYFIFINKLYFWLLRRDSNTVALATDIVIGSFGCSLRVIP